MKKVRIRAESKGYILTNLKIIRKKTLKIYDTHISKSVSIKTDKWTGYNLLNKEFDLKQIKSNKGKSSKELPTIIHQVDLG